MYTCTLRFEAVGMLQGLLKGSEVHKTQVLDPGSWSLEHLTISASNRFGSQADLEIQKGLHQEVEPLGLKQVRGSKCWYQNPVAKLKPEPVAFRYQDLEQKQGGWACSTVR